MARSRRFKDPLEWRDVRSSDGTKLGQYAVDGGMMVVRSVDGWEKRTQLGNPDAQVGLAHMMLMEVPPLSWRRP